MFYIKIVVFVHKERRQRRVITSIIRSELKTTSGKSRQPEPTFFIGLQETNDDVQIVYLSEGRSLFMSMSRHLEIVCFGENIFSRITVGFSLPFCHKNVAFMIHLFWQMSLFMHEMRHLIFYSQVEQHILLYKYIKYFFLFAKIMTKIALSSRMKQHFSHKS